MKKIHKIIFKNFCSHNDTTIIVSEGITTIVGESDQGKTVVPRGLNFVLNNELFVKNYITIGTKGPSELTVIFLDSTFVRRTRSKSINKYEIGFIDNDSNEIVTETISSFGKEMPVKVKSFINSNNVALDKDYTLNLNFSEQMDMPFLFNPKQDKGSIKAKLINAIADIQEFDIALKDANRKVINFNLDVKSYEKSINEKTDELEKYKDIEDKKELLDKIQKKLDKLDCQEKLLKEIKETKNELDIIDTEIEALSEIVEGKTFIEKLEQNISTIENNLSKKTELENVLKEILSIKKEMNTIDSEIVTCKSIVKSSNIIELMEKNLDKAMLLTEKISLRRDKMINIQECSCQIDKIDKEIEIIQSVLSQKSIVNKQDEIIKMLVSKNDSLNQKKPVLSDIKIINKEINHIEEEVTSIRKIIDEKQILKKMEKNINMAIEKIQRKEILEIEKANIEELNGRVKKGMNYILQIKNEYEHLKDGYISGLREFGKCPLCMSDLTEKHLEEVLHEL